MRWLQDLLFQFTEVLLVPVMSVLLLLVAYALFTSGAFAREAWTRRTTVNRRRAHIASIAATQGVAAAGAEVERLELRLARIVDRDTFASRLGPMLGLAGTLIPLAPGLKRLAGGDLAGFAEQLVPAFTTTVTGLAICAVCFWVAGVRGRWYEEDLRLLERTAAGQP